MSANSILPSISFSARHYLAWIVVALLTVSSVLFIAIGSKNALLPSGSHDLQWTPSRDLLAGVNPYEDFLRWKNDGHELTPPHFLNQSPSYPASVYVMIAPLGKLEWQMAKMVWLAINLILIALLLAGLQRQFPIRQPVLLAIVLTCFVCSTPLRASLGAGQMNFLSLAAFLWSYDFAQRKGRINQGISGALLAIAWAKYSLTFPLTLIFINQRNWRPIAVATGIHIALTLIAAYKMNLYPQEFFFSSVAVVLMGSGTGFANVSALAMNLHAPTVVAMAMISLSLVSAAWFVARIQNIQPLLLMSFLAMISLALFYHHNYDFIVLIFLAWCIATEKLGAAATVASFALLFASWCGLWLADEIPIFFGMSSDLAVSSATLLQIITFYGALFFLASNLRGRTKREKVPDGVLAF